MRALAPARDGPAGAPRLDVPRDGTYTFHVRGEGDAVLSVGDVELIDTTGLGPYRWWSARIALKAGPHAVRLRVAPSKGRTRPEVAVEYEGPDLPRRPLPGEALPGETR